MSFRDNLIHLRAENNMTQEQLAMLLGVSRQSVTKWESEKSYPEMDKLIKMCQLFDCTLDDLVQGDLTNREAPAKTQIATTTRPSDIFGYDEHMNRFATKISTGAACPLIGSAIAIIFFSLGDPTGSGFTNPPLTENVGGALGMLFVAIGIVLCLIQVIPAGLAHSEFVRTHPYIEDFYSTEQKTRARQSFTYLTGDRHRCSRYDAIHSDRCLLHRSWIDDFEQDKSYQLQHGGRRSAHSLADQSIRYARRAKGATLIHSENRSTPRSHLRHHHDRRHHHRTCYAVCSRLPTMVFLARMADRRHALRIC